MTNKIDIARLYREFEDYTVVFCLLYIGMRT